MKELLLQYAHYNVWANELIIEAMLRQGEGVAHREVPSSFPTLHQTALHVWSAESIWLQRLQHVPLPIWHAGSFTGSFAEACGLWKQASADWASYLEQQTDVSLQTILVFKYRNGKEGSLMYRNVAQHVLNHSTYHRGQFVTMLRQLGVTDIPGTDYSSFAGI